MSEEADEQMPESKEVPVDKSFSVAMAASASASASSDSFPSESVRERELAAKLQLAESERTILTQRLESLSTSHAALLSDNQSLEHTMSVMMRTHAVVKSTLQETKTSLEQMLALRDSENSELRKEVAALRLKSAADAASDSNGGGVSAEVEQLRAQLAAAQLQAQETEARYQQLQAQFGTLEEQFAVAQEQVGVTEQRLSQEMERAEQLSRRLVEVEAEVSAKAEQNTSSANQQKEVDVDVETEVEAKAVDEPETPRDQKDKDKDTLNESVDTIDLKRPHALQLPTSPEVGLALSLSDVREIASSDDLSESPIPPPVLTPLKPDQQAETQSQSQSLSQADDDSISTSSAPAHAEGEAHSQLQQENAQLKLALVKWQIENERLRKRLSVSLSSSSSSSRSGSVASEEQKNGGADGASLTSLSTESGEEDGLDDSSSSSSMKLKMAAVGLTPLTRHVSFDEESEPSPTARLKLAHSFIPEDQDAESAKVKAKEQEKEKDKSKDKDDKDDDDEDFEPTILEAGVLTPLHSSSSQTSLANECIVGGLLERSPPISPSASAAPSPNKEASYGLEISLLSERLASLNFQLDDLRNTNAKLTTSLREQKRKYKELKEENQRLVSKISEDATTIDQLHIDNRALYTELHETSQFVVRLREFMFDKEPLAQAPASYSAGIAQHLNQSQSLNQHAANANNSSSSKSNNAVPPRPKQLKPRYPSAPYCLSSSPSNANSNPTSNANAKGSVPSAISASSSALAVLSSATPSAIPIPADSTPRAAHRKMLRERQMRGRVASADSLQRMLTGAVGAGAGVAGGLESSGDDDSSFVTPTASHGRFDFQVPTSESKREREREDSEIDSSREESASDVEFMTPPHHITSSSSSSSHAHPPRGLQLSHARQAHLRGDVPVSSSAESLLTSAPPSPKHPLQSPIPSRPLPLHPSTFHSQRAKRHNSDSELLSLSYSPKHPLQSPLPDAFEPDSASVMDEDTRKHILQSPTPQPLEAPPSPKHPLQSPMLSHRDPVAFDPRKHPLQSPGPRFGAPDPYSAGPSSSANVNLMAYGRAPPASPKHPLQSPLPGHRPPDQAVVPSFVAMSSAISGAGTVGLRPPMSPKHPLQSPHPSRNPGPDLDPRKHPLQSPAPRSLGPHVRKHSDLDLNASYSSNSSSSDPKHPLQSPLRPPLPIKPLTLVRKPSDLDLSAPDPRHPTRTATHGRKPSDMEAPSSPTDGMPPKHPFQSPMISSSRAHTSHKRPNPITIVNSNLSLSPPSHPQPHHHHHHSISNTPPSGISISSPSPVDEGPKHPFQSPMIQGAAVPFPMALLRSASDEVNEPKHPFQSPMVGPIGAAPNARPNLTLHTRKYSDLDLNNSFGAPATPSPKSSANISLEPTPEDGPLIPRSSRGPPSSSSATTQRFAFITPSNPAPSLAKSRPELASVNTVVNNNSSNSINKPQSPSDAADSESSPEIMPTYTYTYRRRSYSEASEDAGPAKVASILPHGPDALIAPPRTSDMPTKSVFLGTSPPRPRQEGSLLGGDIDDDELTEASYLSNAVELMPTGPDRS